MVSLSDESRHSGGFFFNENSIQNKDSDDLLSEDLCTELDPPFRKVNTAWAVLLEIIVFILLVVAVFVLPVVCETNKCGGTYPYYLILYVHGGLWWIMLLLDRFYRHHHYRIRLLGYLEFYRRTRHVRRMPFLINSGVNAVLVIMTTALRQSCSGQCGGMHEDLYVQILITLEVVCVVPLLIWLQVLTVKFNRRQASPDVTQEELLTSFINSHTSGSEIGFRDENYTDQLLEKQADMIRYLKQHNTQLGRKLVMLTTAMERVQVKL
ncbi:hypothetical protein ScPMuIL_003137 [Solemya velum]